MNVLLLGRFERTVELRQLAIPRARDDPEVPMFAQKTNQFLTMLLTLPLVGCAPTFKWVPLSAEPRGDSDLTLVWVGGGECERLENGVWVRRPEFDYEFSVEQHRLGDRWESVKSMRRRHPAYDGSAGERTQTYFFVLGLEAPDEQQRVKVSLTSTLGNGTGTTDREFRAAELNFLAVDFSSMAPFDRYRITQRYDYEAGTLTELVELNKGNTPWVRNHEKATLFAAHRFDSPPTRR